MTVRRETTDMKTTGVFKLDSRAYLTSSPTRASPRYIDDDASSFNLFTVKEMV